MDELAELNRIGLESLREHLQAQGLSPRIVEDSLILGRIGDTNLICHCQVHLPSPDSGMHSAITPVGIELSFSEAPNDSTTDFGIGGSRTIHDMLVGLSEDRSEGVVQATHTWSEGVFPPIHHAFQPDPDIDDPRVHPFQLAMQNAETRSITDWYLYLGLPQVGGPEKELMEAAVAEGKLVSLLMNALTTLVDDPKVHWVKVYIAFQPDGSRVFECRLDNLDWEVGTAALHAVQWPRMNGFVQYRQFLILRPSSTPNEEVREHLQALAREVEEREAKTPPAKKQRFSWWPFGKR